MPMRRRREAGVDALEPEQERSIERMTRFLDTLTERLGRLHTDDDEDGKDRGKASAKGAAERLARIILADEKS
jgi:hypothetical protein